MDDMVEKVARAIETACASAAVSSDEYCSPAMAKAAARAAIEAMREPTEAMRSAVEAEESRMGHIMYETITWHQAWPIAIDAALGSKGE